MRSFKRRKSIQNRNVASFFLAKKALHQGDCEGTPSSIQHLLDVLPYLLDQVWGYSSEPLFERFPHGQGGFLSRVQLLKILRNKSLVT